MQIITTYLNTNKLERLFSCKISWKLTEILYLHKSE